MSQNLLRKRATEDRNHCPLDSTCLCVGFTCTHKYMCAHICVHIHVHMHTHSHTYIFLSEGIWSQLLKLRTNNFIYDD